MTEQQVDVFIYGAGPVGLVLAYQLNRLGISTYIIDAADKSSPEMPMYGRASTLMPRTLELLDSIDLYDDLAQEGLIFERSFTYKDGKAVAGRGWRSIVQARTHRTYFPFHLNLRLKFSEDIFRAKIAEQGSPVHAPVKLVDFTLDENAKDGHRVTAACIDPQGNTFKVRARYIVGADGGSSSVRKLAKIPFPGDRKNQHWVRVDGMVKTNIPEERIGVGAIESDTHGHVLWVSLDHGATRIGYVLSQSLFEKYGYQMSQEEAIHEAKLACAPFEVEFTRVDWHTVYGIQQHVAERFVDRERVILAGEAAHTHSSGTAQGMNTGMHDVSSLGWRLAGSIKGWYQPGVLDNYSEERHSIAETLIDNDKTISMLMSGEKPQDMKDRPEHHMVLLGGFMDKIASFGSGLGISYPENLLNNTKNAFQAVNILPGHRYADALLHKQGFRQLTVRLHEVTKNNGKFKVAVFTGKADLTRPRLHSLRTQVDAHHSRFAHAVEFLTIIESSGLALEEHLGVPKFGKGFWDIDSNAHWAYGLGDMVGALLVFRPDGILGASAPLDQFEDIIVPYLSKIVVERAPTKQPVNGKIGFGELLNPSENTLKYSARNAQMVA